MSPDPFDGGSRSRRGVWSHWVPLAITLTVATAGVAAWAWSQRKDSDDDDEPGLDYDNADYGDNPAYGASRTEFTPSKSPRPQQPPYADDQQSFGVAPGPSSEASAPGWGARMSGALRRTPSPQQLIDSTGKSVAAGFAAMGKALASIREEDKYSENNPWSEEADLKQERAPASTSKKRKTVVLVVSADSSLSEAESGGYHEHASILSHIPRHNDFSKIKLFILIYAPSLKDTPLDPAASSNLPPPSLSSSYSNIEHNQAQTPGDEAKSPQLNASTNPAFNAVYSQALSLVDKETMVIPFTTPNGHVHILRHLQPEVVYLQESLSGDNGSIITNLQTWLRYDVILVVGAESSGGLADSESEAERNTKVTKWWQKPERVGRGRGVVVVDGGRVHDDWTRRVQGLE
ncbi:unnamed protein product [Clonostachys chloroleuca]|uniref:Peroxin 22-like protein n=1 Tax=Clonostachys chloroleuca TaxID=1926264 RepID=A0AA35VK57_9HYPO|nr:unnamed protein product [Clonostachys chloroleuca]